MTDSIITINNDEYEPIQVDRNAYVKAKTKDLREFGYADITEEAVSEQLAAALSGDDLNVIGIFIKRDLYEKE